MHLWFDFRFWRRFKDLLRRWILVFDSLRLSLLWLVACSFYRFEISWTVFFNLYSSFLSSLCQFLWFWRYIRFKSTTFNFILYSNLLLLNLLWFKLFSFIYQRIKYWFIIRSFLNCNSFRFLIDLWLFKILIMY